MLEMIEIKSTVTADGIAVLLFTTLMDKMGVACVMWLNEQQIV